MSRDLSHLVKIQEGDFGNAEAVFTTNALRIRIVETAGENTIYFRWSVYLGESVDESLSGVAYTMEMAQSAAISTTNALLDKVREQLLNCASLCMMQHSVATPKQKEIWVNDTSLPD